MTPSTTDLVVWFGTYLLHSTVVLGSAWAVCRLLRPGAGVRERVWKCALILPIVTTTVQGAWPEHVIVAPRFEIAAADAARLDAQGQLVPLAPELGATGSPAGSPGGAPTGSFGGEAGPGLREFLGLALFALVSLLPLAVPSLRLAFALRRRRRLLCGLLVEEATDLGLRAGLWRPVRITVSERVGSPVAIGTLRPEICVPPRALELPRPLARALIAHELAHHARLDPLWNRLAHAAVAVLFLQPLNRLARRELVACAELLADDLAVEWTDDRFGLARCLTEVAGWARPNAPAAAAVAMVRHRKRTGLRERVERALDRPRERVVKGLAPLALGLGIAMASAAPGVTRSLHDRGEAAQVLSELRQQLSTIDADLRALLDHDDPTIQDHAAALFARRAQLENSVHRLVRSLTEIANETNPQGDPIR